MGPNGGFGMNQTELNKITCEDHHVVSPAWMKNIESSSAGAPKQLGVPKWTKYRSKFVVFRNLSDRSFEPSTSSSTEQNQLAPPSFIVFMLSFAHQKRKNMSRKLQCVRPTETTISKETSSEETTSEETSKETSSEETISFMPGHS